MTTFRWDLSSRSVIMTQDDPSGPALTFAKGSRTTGPTAGSW